MLNTLLILNFSPEVTLWSSVAVISFLSLILWTCSFTYLCYWIVNLTPVVSRKQDFLASPFWPNENFKRFPECFKLFWSFDCTPTPVVHATSARDWAKPALEEPFFWKILKLWNVFWITSAPFGVLICCLPTFWHLPGKLLCIWI